MTAPPPLMGLPSEREEVWDVIRGVGILGIFLLHVFLFSQPTVEGMSRELSYDTDWLFLLSGALGNGKFIAMLAMTFGAGFAMVAARDLQRGRSPAEARKRLLRRCVVLLGLGVLHYVFLFWGDILQWYGLAGLVVALLVRWPDAWLKWLSGVLLLVALVLGTGMMGVDVLAGGMEGEVDAGWPETSDGEAEVFSGGSYLAQVLWRLRLYPMGVLMMVPELPMIVGLMLLGVLVWRRGWLARPSRHPGVTRWVLGVGLGVGLPLNLLTALVTDPAWMGLLMYPQRTVGGLMLGGGLAMALAVAVERGMLRRLTWVLACVGRRALTCYLLQSVLGTLVFYGVGLGLYGRLGQWQLLGVLLSVWGMTVTAALALEVLGVRGPAEWAWRKLAPTA